ncbi:hypothetical protein P280DRAFT_518382 [Massarina eburnea CBS 473.64]|uniref:Uncharacterized protein n=1 Tax=Massarina eburnea CBS 473.64 TaxID=1395130 RepID=A0A6A6RXU0_9PLEO|nr:hypothetical protein P280DRAFT_518382 [Massarina eburnea CBS 473.64]
MASFIQNMIWNQVEGFVETGKRAAGGYAGSALIKAGDLVESGGRSVGNGVEKKATSYGSAITGQKYQPSAKALPSTARKPALGRSNSSPAATGVKRVAPTSKTPLGANKFAGAAQKQITSGGAKGAGAVGGLGKTAGSTVGKARSAAGSTAGGAAKSLPKPYSDSKPFGRANSLPKPYGQDNGPRKTTAVKPGQPKPFTPPQEKNEGDKKPYAGAGSKTPVKKYKPMKRLDGPAEYGKAQHISV